MNAYRDAIQQAVKPGDVVIDLGTGTGILAMLAARSGAKRVYAVERTNLAKTTEEIIRLNGFGDTIKIINDDIQKIDIPEKVDVILGELLGSFGVEESVLELYNLIITKYLKSGGKIIPQDISFWVTPIQYGIIENKLKFWENFLDLNFTPMQDVLSNFPLYDLIQSDYVVSPPKEIGHIDLMEIQSDLINFETEFEFSQNAAINGFCGWFKSKLADGVFLDNSIVSPATHWEQIVFPIFPQVDICAGDQVKFKISSIYYGKEVHFNWFATFKTKTETIRRKNASFLGLQPPENIKDWFKVEK